MGSPFAKEESSRGTTDSLPKTDFLKVVETPADRLAIGTDQVEAIELGTEDRVLRPFDEYGDGREVNDGRTAALSGLDQDIYDFSVGGGGDLDPEDVMLLGPASWLVGVASGIRGAGRKQYGFALRGPDIDETHTLLSGLFLEVTLRNQRSISALGGAREVVSIFLI